MASKIGVYFDVQNIGGGLDVEALAEQVRGKWSDLAPVVKVLPMLSAAEDEVRADIEASGLDGVLFCGASPRDEATPWQLPVQVEHVNLREQCVLAYKNPDGSAVSGAAPALLTQMATDYVNMGVVKLQKSNVPDSAAIEGIKRILVIGGGWTGLTAAQEAARTGYEVILVEKADKLGGAVNNMPVGSPLQAPWEDRLSPATAASPCCSTPTWPNWKASPASSRPPWPPPTANRPSTSAPWSWPPAGCRWLKSIWKAWAWA